MIIFEFVDHRGRGVITVWRDGLEPPQQAQFDNKIDLLRREPKLLEGMMAGPLKGYRHLYKLQIGGKVRLRPLLCRGPVNVETELTLLAGAKEIGGTWEPPGARETAEANRKTLMLDRTRRQVYDDEA